MGSEPEDRTALLAAVTELGTSLRDLVDAAVTTTVDDAELRAVAAEVRVLTARLAAQRRPPGRLSALDDPARFRRVYNPVSGVGSPLAPPLTIRRADGGVLAEATLGLAYEGPPGYVHGGISALLLDQLLGSAALAGGLWGMTARLELDYRAPVPLDTPLTLHGRVTDSAGRKTVIAGGIALAAAPDRPLVQARGVFVTPRPEQVEAYFGTVTDASGRPSPPRRAGDATALDENR